MTSGVGVRVALLAAVAVALVVGIGRVAHAMADGGSPPDALLPWLVALALACIGALAVGRHPTLAWLATIAALTILTIDLVALARILRPTLAPDAWRWLAILIATAGVLATSAAVAYAATRWRPPMRAVIGLAGLGVFAVLIAGVWALASIDDPTATGLVASPIGSLTAVTRVFLGVTGVAVAIGIAMDLRPIVARTNAQVRSARSTRPASSAPRDRSRDLSAWMRAFISELAPGRGRAHQAALDERTRLARALHADVVPPIRRALALAEAGASPDRLAASLREALVEVEAVGMLSHPLPLETGGLVQAVEWLAERIEDRSDVTIVIDVDGPAASGPPAGDPPIAVAAAAFRVAALALDNAVRHAPGSRVSMTIDPAADRLAMAIVDDGPGIDASARSAAATTGRRGLADMATEASACGATLTIDSVSGRGTRIAFDWRTAT